MNDTKKSITVSITACFIFLIILTICVFFGPFFAKLWFSVYRGWSQSIINDMITLFSVCFYPSSIFAYITLYSLLKLLFNIKKDEIFITANVKYLRIISWCCFVVFFITFIGGIFYIPFIFISVAAVFMGLMLHVVKNVMENAVEIKNENELTI